MKTPVFFFSLFFTFNVCFGQWTPQVSNTVNTLKDLHFLNDSVGFVVGNGGDFLKTTDKGENWQLSVIPDAGNLAAVYAIDQDTIFVAGNTKILKTTDGGQIWNVINSQLKVNELKFFSSQVGFAKAEWEEQCPYPNQGSAYRYKYYRTLDGGSTWNYFPLFEDHTVSWAEMEIVTADTGYMGAMEIGFWCSYWPCCESGSGYFFRTTDGGLNWTELNAWQGSGILSDVAFMNGQEGFYIREQFSPYGFGCCATLFKVNDSGSEMIFVHELPDYNIGKFFFANSIEGYYLEGHDIMKTATEGYFWQPDHIGETYLTDLATTENFETYVIGWNGTILHKKVIPATEPEPLYWLNCNKDKFIFPMTNINEGSILNFTLSATGNRDITVDIISSGVFDVKPQGGGEFVQQIQGLSIPARRDTVIQVRFQPGAYQHYTGMIEVTSNATNLPLVTMPAYGKGVCFLPEIINNDTSFCYDTVWVRDHVTVYQEKSLTFCPGTVIKFNGGYQFNIHGTLTAIGDLNDSIRFYSDSRWNGMIISDQGPGDSVVMQYCRIANRYLDGKPQRSNGGGLQITGNVKADVSHCTFMECHADNSGGGIYCTSNRFKISDSRFYRCGAKDGGAIYYNSGVKNAIIDCFIEDCGASNSGGGIYLYADTDSVIMNCTVISCAADFGGGMYLGGNRYSIHGCVITGCEAESGGGIFAGGSGHSLIENCKINGCSAMEAGGIKINYNAKLHLESCHIAGCTAEVGGGGLFNAAASDNEIRNCIIEGNRVNNGDGGGILVYWASPVISGNDINWNFAYGGKGGGLCCFDSQPLILNNLIFENIADSAGGGIYIENWDAANPPRIVQNLIHENASGYGNGGGIALRNTSSYILLNTIADNLSVWANGDGIYFEQAGTTRALGNIVYNNGSVDIGYDNLSGIELSYCDLRSPWPGNGEENIYADPEFYGLPYYPWYLINQDFSIMPGSPCVDFGPVDTTGLNLPVKDFAGNPRFIGGRLDIGAYENNFLYQAIDTGFCEGQDFMIETIPIQPELYTSNIWTFNGETIPGENSNQLLIKSPDSDDEGSYQCIFTGESGQTLQSRKIYLYNKGFAPLAQEQPVGAVLNQGDNYEMVFAVYSPDNATTYQWYLNDSPLEFQNERVIYISDFSSQQQGAYQCRVENTCGEVISEEAILQLNSSAIGELQPGAIRVFPNPAVDWLFVSDLGEGECPGCVKTRKYQLCDLYGRVLLLSEHISALPVGIDISSLPDGMYLLRMTSEDGEPGTARFVKTSW